MSEEVDAMMNGNEAAQRPRILLLTHEIPYPADRNGWSVITYPILRYLSSTYDIDLIFPVSDKDEYSREDFDVLQKLCVNVYTYKVSRNFIKRAVTALFHPLPLVFVLCSKKQFLKKIYSPIAQHINDYRAVIIADTHSARFINELDLPQDARKIFIASDFLTLMFKRIGSTSSNFFSKVYHWLTYQKLRFFEPSIYDRFDDVVYVSTEDKKKYIKFHPQAKNNIVVIPNGINFAREQEISVGDKNGVKSLLFVGNMGYIPNRQAVNWFYDNVFQSLKRDCEGIQFVIVGRSAAEFINIKDDKVIIHDSVPSVAPYLKKATLVISPLQSGSGLKNKVIEAMSYKKVVVGSSLSFDGIPIINGTHGIVVNTPDEYIKGIKRMVEEKDTRRRIGESGFNLVRENFDIQSITKKWQDLIEK